MNTFLTQTEASERLRISARTLERWRVEGAGPKFRRFGRRIVYASEDLSDWAEAHRFQSTAEADAAA